MRSAKEQEYFPYNSPTVCFIEVTNAGRTRQLTNKTDKTSAIENAEHGLSTIYAVWPGKWRSDLFIIDDLETFRNNM